MLESFAALLQAQTRQMRESNIQFVMDNLSRFPDQILLRGPRALMIFQPHAIASVPDILINELCDSLIEQQAEQYIEDGRKVVFFIEDAGKKTAAKRRNRVASLRNTNQADREINKLIMAQTQSSDISSSIYQMGLLLTAKRLRSQFPDGTDQRILLLTEQAPKIQKPGDQAFREIDPKTNAPDVSFRRMLQVLSFVATRDVAAAAQLLNELKNHPDSAFIIVRGSSHVGLATCLEEMATMAYPQYVGQFADVDASRISSTDDILHAVITSLFWKRAFWRNIFEQDPRLLRMANKSYLMRTCPKPYRTSGEYWEHRHGLPISGPLLKRSHN